MSGGFADARTPRSAADGWSLFGSAIRCSPPSRKQRLSWDRGPLARTFPDAGETPAVPGFFPSEPIRVLGLVLPGNSTFVAASPSEWMQRVHSLARAATDEISIRKSDVSSRRHHSTVTDFARLRGLSTSQPRSTAM
jgi:hypothetical protein